jgi:hypothetical protein
MPFESRLHIWSGETDGLSAQTRIMRYDTAEHAKVIHTVLQAAPMS